MASAATLGILIKTDDKASPGLQKIGGAAGQMGRTFQNNSKVIGASMTAIGASIVAASVLSIKSFIEMGDEVHKMALRTGFTTERLSELKFAAEQSGTSIGSIDKAVKTMNKALIDADRGLETYARSFRELGLTTEELLALSPEEQFNTIAIALSELEDQTKKSAIAQEVFGRSGTQLLPMLAAGADGIAALSQEARDLGIVLDQEAADAAAKMTDDMNSLSKAMDGIKFQIAQALLPIINDLVEQITAAITSVKDWAAENPGLADTITKVGLAVGVLGVALGPVVLALPIIVTALPLLKAGLVALVSPLGKVKLAAVAVGAAIAVIVGKTTELGDLAKALGGTAKALDGTAKPYVSSASAAIAGPIRRVIGQGLQMDSELAAIEAVALGPYYDRAAL
ncbi:phage tail tape measure protein, partial [Candidatus Pacearchaeota archaeon]|nr:phage tail tape measure protein [Candidatus Pacearchaeota archaeon]